MFQFKRRNSEDRRAESKRRKSAEDADGAVDSDDTIYDFQYENNDNDPAEMYPWHLCNAMSKSWLDCVKFVNVSCD